MTDLKDIGYTTQIETSKYITDPFWYDDIEILWDSDRLIEFFPSKDHTIEERLNAIMRLCIYISILLLAYGRKHEYIFIAVGGGLFTYYIYKNKSQREKELKKLHFEELSKIEGFEDIECSKPTLDNPFMNATMKDYMNIKEGKIVDRPPACDITVPDVKEEVDKLFNNNLYRDIDDVFGKMNSQRQFYTMPSTTIPNDRESFQKWLYDSPMTCKEDQNYCLRQEDIRAKSMVFYDNTVNPAVSK